MGVYEDQEQDLLVYIMAFVWRIWKCKICFAWSERLGKERSFEVRIDLDSASKDSLGAEQDRLLMPSRICWLVLESCFRL